MRGPGPRGGGFCGQGQQRAGIQDHRRFPPKRRRRSPQKDARGSRCGVLGLHTLRGLSRTRKGVFAGFWGLPQGGLPKAHPKSRLSATPKGPFLAIKNEGHGLHNLLGPLLGAGYRSESVLPAQKLATGHWPQPGSFGVQRREPSSIRAWFQVPGLAGSRRAWAVSWSQRFWGFSTAKRRAKTRRTFPSTTATSSPNATEATAAAV